MRIGSLFAGIGGFDLAAEWCGWETAWYAEIDLYASHVMAEAYPNAVNHGDVTKIDGRAVEPVDLLCGGFPCQDISLAGKGAGLAGQRSGLWSEYARIIYEVRPRWIVIENVAALRSRGLDRVLLDLDALGYVGEWHCIPASAVGANHRRDRIWIIAYAQRDALRLESERGESHAPLGWDSLFGDDGPAESVADSLGELGGLELGGADALGERTRPAWDEPRGGSEAPAGPVGDAGLESVDRLHGHGGAERGGAAPSQGAVDAHEPDRRGDDARRSDVADALSSRLEGYAGDGARGAGGSEPDGSAREASLRDGGGAAALWRSEPADGTEWWAAEPDVGRVAHGVPARVDRLKCLGNAIVPQVAYVIFRAIEAREARWERERETAHTGAR